MILSGTNQQHGKFGHISHMSVKFGHQVTLSSNKFQINSTKKIYFQRPQHFLVEFERKNGTCTGRAIIQRRATADYAPRNQHLRWRLPLLAASRRRRSQKTLVRATYPTWLPVADGLPLIANLFFDVFMSWEHQKIEIQGITDPR